MAAVSSKLCIISSENFQWVNFDHTFSPNNFLHSSPWRRVVVNVIVQASLWFTRINYIFVVIKCGILGCLPFILIACDVHSHCVYTRIRHKHNNNKSASSSAGISCEQIVDVTIGCYNHNFPFTISFILTYLYIIHTHTVIPHALLFADTLADVSKQQHHKNM